MCASPKKDVGGFVNKASEKLQHNGLQGQKMAAKAKAKAILFQAIIS